MVTFTTKISNGLERRGFETTQRLGNFPLQAILVVGGTRDLPGLWQAKRRGIPIIQRLDGMNWLHRLSGPLGSGLRHYLRAEYANLLLSFIRSRLADRVIYQSKFSKDWWERKKGKTRVDDRIVYNGVDLEHYCPEGPEKPPDDRWRVLMVEGSLMGGYEQGLKVAMRFMQRLAERLVEQPAHGYPGLLELNIVGRVAEILRSQWDDQISRSGFPGNFILNWTGLVPPQQIPAIDRSAHILYSSDINPACPNSVIEALACGLPVAAFDTGALSELVDGDAGRIVSYGGDPWQLDTPDINGLAEAALEVLSEPDRFQAAARSRAEQLFGLDRMVEAYLGVMLEA